MTDTLSQLMGQGYAVIRNAVTLPACELALVGIDAFKRAHPAAIRDNANEHGQLYRVVNMHLAIDALANVFAENSALATCDEFFGEPATLYTSLYYERGSEQALHRDTPYFCTHPADRYLGVWLALDDVDSGNGPLRVVPRSHLLPAIDVDALARKLFPDPSVIPAISDAGWNAYQAAVQHQCDERGMQAQEVHVQRGDVIIWHPSMFHGGSPHRVKQRSRRSLVMHVTPQGVPVHQIDVFLNPDKPVAAKAAWRYYRHGQRRIARFREIDFGHTHKLPVRRLRWPWL
ncbi:phytanoyl-CoA dioxygenase family protein [Rhodanobacter fulvus]|nr:phytanoyl-CoA dioxygenase family protein [Rhodanobacter fulvus]